MFKNIGLEIRVFCDYESRVVRVAANLFADHPQLIPQWNEVAQFCSSEEWYASSYARKVSNTSTEEDIAWFWRDMAEPSPQES